VELIGREQEMGEVIDRLSDRRLVTLIGPAGIGKTALANAVSARLAPRYELGAHAVDLTRVDTADAVEGALAGQLGFGSFEALLSSPSEQPALIVVDNCEHVTAAAADAIDALLDACRSPTVLATSRSPLDLPVESLVVLGPLGVPRANTADLDNDSVRLFLERARDAGAAIADDQLEAVAVLCRRLDGVPLALELAAAQTRSIQPAEILQRLSTGVDVLARPRFRGDRRHRSLSATIEWSYRLLPVDVAALFDRLGLFAGPFTAEMVTAVGSDVGLGREEADDALQLLVDSSLVSTEARAGTTSFRLLETVKAFAVRRLEEQGVLDEARSRLADHVVAAAADIIADGARRWDPSIFGRLRSMYDNIVSALRWCLAHDADGTRSFMLCAVLWGVVHQGHTEEIASLCDQAIERWPDARSPFLADAVATAATARVLTGDPRGAYALAERTLDAVGRSPTAPVTLRRAMAYAARALDDRGLALRQFTEVSAQARERGLVGLALEADVSRAQLMADDVGLDPAIEVAESARREAIAVGSPVNEVWAQSILALFHLRQDLPRGLVEVHAALDAARRIDYPAAISVNLRSLAWGSIRSGRPREAAEALSELFDGLMARDGVADAGGALYTTAELLHVIGSPAWPALAATSATLPLIGLTGGPIDKVVQLPDHAVRPLSRRDAIVLARRELREYLAQPGDPEPPGPPVPPVQPAARPGLLEARLVDHGDYWEIDFAGRAVHAKASKGVADLARLLTAPSREVHCLELMGGQVDQASTGDMLDQTARRQYEARIRDLQRDIDDAEADNDYVRAERARTELDTLVDHLTAALGLGSRTRRGGSSAERARSAVTQRLRSTIRRLGAAHPELGRHLEASVTTGTYCVYRPEHPVEWRS
jgi:predicted ATPase